MFGTGPRGTIRLGLICKPGSQLEYGTATHDTYREVRPVVMHLDMFKIRRLLECWVVPIEFAEPSIRPTISYVSSSSANIAHNVRVNGRITRAYCAEVALEMSVVYGIEPHLRSGHE